MALQTIATVTNSPIISGDASHIIAGDLVVNGTSVPWYTITVDINAFSMASVIEATAPIYPLDGNFDASKATDWAPILQANPLTPIVARAGIAQTSGPVAPTTVPLNDIEQGYVDEVTHDYAANEVKFVGRSTASVFQDNRLGDNQAFPKNLSGSGLVAKLASQRGFTNTQITSSPSGVVIGAGYINNQQVRAFRGMSEWDEMQQAAFNDGYVLWVHNGLLYYGPHAVNAPTLKLKWGRDLLNLEVNHAARRSHDVTVLGVGTIRKNGARVFYKYSGASPSATTNAGAGEIIPIKFGFVKDQSELVNKVTSAYQDVIRREFITTLEVVPGPSLLKFVAQNGANFLVELSGGLPSANKTYHAKQVRMELNADSDSPYLKLKIICEIHPSASGGYA